MFNNVNVNCNVIWDSFKPDSFIVEYASVKYLPYPIEISRFQESVAVGNMFPPEFIESRQSVVAIMLGAIFPHITDEDFMVFYVRYGNLDKYFVLNNGFLELVNNSNSYYYQGSIKYGM